jgi:hypothetical protein
MEVDWGSDEAEAEEEDDDEKDIGWEGRLNCSYSSEARRAESDETNSQVILSPVHPIFRIEAEIVSNLSYNRMNWCNHTPQLDSSWLISYATKFDLCRELWPSLLSLSWKYLSWYFVEIADFPEAENGSIARRSSTRCIEGFLHSK